MLSKKRFFYPLWKFFNHSKADAKRGLDSIVIPCVGEKYTEEGTLAANFAKRAFGEVVEVVLVTNQQRSAFLGLSSEVIVKTVFLPETSRKDFKQIWQSRIIKIQSPVYATGENILIMDSDIMLAQPFDVVTRPGVLMGSFRKGRAFSKVKEVSEYVPEVENSVRVKKQFHMNGGFLLAHRDTWKLLSPLWEQKYRELWDRIPQDWAPRDQLPLMMCMDELEITSVDLGFWMNWSVPKNMGKKPMQLPSKVIGAHGGFPLTEWKKYWEDSSVVLDFRDQSYTRKVRYENKPVE